MITATLLPSFSHFSLLMYPELSNLSRLDPTPSKN
jgi:hypothetical protein